MCDCFHLAFPNWHAPAAGAGRRLRGPEQEAEDNSVCEDPEIVEGERPRPQGSSPVEEFPIEKQVEEDISDLARKSGSNKKGRKAGFGSLFDKRTSDKMSDTEDMQCGESEIIVKTVKEACVEGLVVTGGGKEGIFIKEVKVDSPASKHLSVKEGDQILSATVYFDNVSYEDALQILEHAQPYKMEFCLRRKVEPTIPENAEIKYPKEKEQGTPTMRNQRKMKKKQERISWPKFPSFGKGPRVQFKRSHSTSEAEEHRKLEMSPPTSDTESPLKSPLKCPDGKDKKKKHKVQLKMKMKGHRSKSVEESQSSENVLVWENQQVEGILEEKFPEGHEEKMQEILQVLDGAENEVSFKTGNDEAFQSFSGMEMHETHLISLGNTLKTTDISVALAETAKIESSEMKVRIYQKEKPDIGTEKQAESTKALHSISDPFACDNVVLSQTEVKIGKLDNEDSNQGLGKYGSEKKVESGNAELSIPNLDICVGVTKTSPRIGNERQLQDKSVFENESYGIRTRGPLADIATSKSHFVSTVNGLQFMSSDFSEIMQVGKISEDISDTKKPKPGSTVFAEDSPIVKTSKLPTETSAPKFKLPKVDLSGLVTHELINMTEVEKNRMNLPKREDIEIPGMENKDTKPILKTPKIKVTKIEKTINITKDPETYEEFNVEDVKVAVSKFPAFKLPEGDITGVLVQKEIELKSTLSPRGSPHKVSITSTDSTIIPISKVGEDIASDTEDKNTVIKMPKVEPPYIDEQTSTAVMKIDYTQSHLTDYERFGELNIKLPKREDIEISGMEAIKETKLQNTADLDQVEKPRTKKHGDKKGHEKKSKKPKINIQGSESTKPDTQSSDIGSELPKMDSSNINTEETKILEKQKFKTPNIDKVKNIEVQIQETKILEDNMDNMDLPQKTETKFGRTKFKIPYVTMPEFGTKVTREEADISAVDMQGKKAEQKLPEDKIKLSDKPLLSELNVSDMNKDSQSVNVYDSAQDTETEGQGRKFKLPKFEISFPEVKAPRISCTSKKDDDSSLSEESGKMPVVHLPEGELPAVKHEDLPDKDSQTTEMKIKRPGFSLPRFGISKTEPIAPAADVTLTNVDVSLPEGHTKMEDPNTNIAISVKDCKDKDTTKFSSPTKFKIPSIRFPHFGVKVSKTAMETSDVDVNVKGPEISLPQSELKLPEEPILIDIKVPDIDKQKESVGMEPINMDIQSELQGNKFKLPKFGVRLPEVKGPKLNVNADKAGIDISKPEVKVQINPPDIEVQGVTPKVNVDVTGPEITLTDADISTEQLSVDIKGPDADKGMKSLSVKMKDQDIQMKEKGSKFKLPKYEISPLEVKGPKVDVSLDKRDIDLSVPKAKVKIHPSNVEGQGVTDKIKANLPEVDSKDIETKKTQGFLFPEIELRKSEVKATEGDITFSNVDVSLPEGSIEIERTSTDVALSMGDAQQKSRSKFGSPTKFKLPSINFPKFGTKGPKALVEVSDVDVSVKGPEITLSDAEVKLSAYPQPMDVTRSNVDKEIKPSTVEMTDQDIQMKEKGSKFKLPKFGISLPEVKGPKLDVNLEKVDRDSEKGEGVTAETKTDLPEVDSKNIEMKIKSPGFSLPKIGFGKSEEKASEGNVSLPYVDVSLPEGSIEIERPATEVTLPMEDAEQKVRSKFGSPTKFKLPSVSFPKFGTKGPKASVEFPDVDVDIKGPEINLPDAQMKWSAEPLSVDIKGPGLNKEIKSLCVEMKDQDIQMEEQESKFKLPKFGISLPDVKGPEIDVSLDKAEIDISVPKAKVHLPEAELQGITAKLKADLPEVDSKDIELKMKTPGVSTKIGFSESELKAPKGDVSLSNVTVSLPEESIDMERPSTDIKISLENAEQKDPSKFKLPSISFPKFGTKGPKASVKVSDVDVDVKQPEITLPDAEMNLSAEPLSVAIKGLGVDKETKPFNVEIKERNIQLEDQESKFKLPNFGIRLPELKGPKIDISSDKAKTEISVPEANLEMATPNVKVQGVTVEIKADMPEVDSKDHEMKIKTSGFSFPKIDFSKSDVKASEGDESLLNIDMSLPKGSIEMERPATDFSLPMEDAEQKSRSKFGSPTKFKLPSISLPKFGTKGPKASVEVSDVDVDVKGPEISLPDAEKTLSAEPLSVDIKRPDAEKGTKPLNVEIKDQNIQMKEQGSKFKLPKFGISLPDVKGPKIDISSDKAETHISLPDANLEMPPPNVKVQGVTAEIKAGLPEVSSKDLEMKIKTPGFSFHKTALSKSDVEAPEGDVSLPNVDMSFPEGSIEIERPSIDVSLPMENVEQKSRSKFASPTKFKLPSVNFPKFGTKGPKASVEVSDVDVDAKGPEITLPDAEIKLSAEPISVNIKGPHLDKEINPPNVEMKDEDVQMKEQWSKFRLPKLVADISLDKVDSDISVPKAKVEVHPPDAEVHCVTAEIKAGLPEVHSKEIELKMKKPGLSFPKIGFGKSEVKAPEGDVSFPNVDVAVSEESVEIERPATDVTISDTEHKVRSKFGSPTKFKLPSINFPKFGTKGPKASVEVSDVDVDIKEPEITLPDAKIKLSAEPLSVDVKGPVVDKEMKPPTVEIKDQDIQMKDQASKFKLPKFGISLPEVKGPKIDRSKNKAEIDISVAKAKAGVHPTDVEIQGVTAEIKADLSKSDVKASEGDVNLLNVDMSKGSIEIQRPSTDVSLLMKDTEQKSRPKFGSPTKFKLPSINLPKFGTKGPKSSVDVFDVEVDVKGPEINLPDAEMTLSTEPLKVDIKGPDVEKEIKPPKVEMKDKDMQIKEQGGKFKLPKFEIRLPEIKAPRLDVRSDKDEIDISVSKTNVEDGLPDAEMHRETAKIKADLPEVNSKDTEVKMRTPGFSFPGIGFSKPEGKVPKGDVNHPNVNVSLPEGSIEIEKAATDITLKMEDAEQKDQSKFGSQTKFKLPSINFPKFGTKGPKASVDDSDVDVDVKEPQISLPDTELKLLVEPIKVDVKRPDAGKEIKPLSLEVKYQDIQMKEKGSKFKLAKFGISLPEVKGPTFDASLDKAEIDISVPKAKTEVHPPDAEVQGVKAEIKADLPEVESKGIDVKMKGPGLSFPKFSTSDSKANNEAVITKLDSQVEKCGDGDTAVNNNAFDVILEPKQKYAKEVKMSSKSLSAKFGDVFSGFEVEFNVPTFDEIEETKQKYLDTLKHEHELNVSECISKPEDGDAQEKSKAGGQKQTTKDDVTFQFCKKAEHSPPYDINENESKKSFTRDINEDYASPTLSLSSSDAFADESSALTSEQIGLSLASPTVVKVKYFEPTANAAVSEIHGDIITSTARSELISMDPHQPEKVNIPFSSETSSSSVVTLKQMSGHIVVSNVQSVSKTEHAAILTRVDAWPSEKASDSMSVEETVIRKGHTVVEKHVVKKIFGGDKEKMFVTQKIQVFEGDSSEPISDGTASSIQKLRDTVHTEKLKFFEGAESSKTVIMSTETLLRHADSSTDENEGK